jgi:crescentin
MARGALMGKLSNLFGRQNPVSISEIGLRRFPTDTELEAPASFAPTPAPTPTPNDEPMSEPDDTDAVELESAADTTARLGEENEVLRNLLSETERKLGEFDDLKVAFANLIEPAHKALRTLEQEKTRGLGLQRSLAQLRNNHDLLQTKFFNLEARAAELENENEKLQRDVLAANQTLRTLTESKSDLSHELAVARATVADLERQQQQHAANFKAQTEENLRLRDQAVRADARGGELETQLNAARQKLMLLEGDKASLQKSLDRTVSEASRLSQSLTETETALTTTRTRLLSLETRLAEVEPERSRLLTELNEVQERYRAEQNRTNIQFEAVQARAEMAEKLLANTRQLLATRVEDARVADRRTVESAHARDSAEKKAADLDARNKLLAGQLQDIEQSHAKLSERASALTATVKTRDAQLADAEEKLRFASERISRFDTDMKMARMAAERRIDELNTIIGDERVERQVLEGALKAARQECGQLQRELSHLRLQRRSPTPTPPEPAVAPEPVPLKNLADRGANAA